MITDDRGPGRFSAYGAFSPSVSVNPPRRVPARVAQLIAMEKALLVIATAPTVSRDAAVAAMNGFYAAATPLLNQAFYAHRADYILALWGAGDPAVSKQFAELSGTLVANWINRADKVLALRPAGWETFIAEGEKRAVELLRGATEFAGTLAEVVGEIATKMGRSVFDMVPWYVWFIGVGAVAAYFDLPRRLGLVPGRGG